MKWFAQVAPNGSSAWYRTLYDFSEDFYRFDRDQRYGLSVRCVRDAE